MIGKIKIIDTASFAGQTDISLRKLNFIYGANGSGKTTISKILKSPESYGNCSLDWTTGDHEEIVVYNRPFVSKNFEENEDLLGIFTLGEDSIAVQHEIEEIRNRIEQARQERDGFNNSITTQSGKLSEEKQAITETCWAMQVKYGADFADAMTGTRGSKERFLQKCLESYNGRSAITLLDYQAIQEKYAAAFAKKASPIEEYALPGAHLLEALKSNDLLEKVITGKSDTPIGTFIQFLRASDWVKQGVSLAKQANGKCPYCQRDLPHSIEQDIEDFFDEVYIRDCEELKDFYASYVRSTAIFNTAIQTVLDNRHEMLSYEEFEKLFDSFKEKSKRNEETIKRKLDTPSEVISIEPVFDLATNLIQQIESFNSKIREHNAIIDNQATERNNVRDQVWRFIISEIEEKLAEYLKQKSGLESGIKELRRKADEKQAAIDGLNSQAEEKEATLTSVKPTVTAINTILTGFGFDGFKLAENTKKKGTYAIIRPDGSDASTTLSEGEHNFLTFLYFYHLCFGSQNSTGLLQDRILVIDDPISSMDSSVLFIVSTLVKTMIDHCRKGEKGIKQVIVLTHNVYFHKEITFLGSRNRFAKEEASFFILRKKNEITSVESFDENPIMSSYEMLWEDLRNPSSSTSKGVFNTMRRILEYYFTVIGGIDYEKCINQFEGEDKIACKALVAYINDGSHSVYDDLIVPIEDSALENYQRIFRLIFEKLNHIDHYNMMMKIEA